MNMQNIKEKIQIARSAINVKKISKIIVIALLVIGVLLAILNYAIIAFSRWNDNTRILTYKIAEYKTTRLGIQLNFNKPWEFVKRTTTPEAILVTTDDLLLTEENESEDLMKLVNDAKNPAIAMLIVTTFVEEPETMLATLKAESGLNPNAMNWNCVYVENNREISRACRSEEDRKRAWSVDCGVAQLNFSGTECPKDAFDPIWNIKTARKKYDRQGKNAWVAYTNGSYQSMLIK